jgi:DNA modification methylase
MKYKEKNYTLYLGNSLDILDTLPDNSVDSIVTDPPYEIGFMGKGWDNTGIAFNVEIWKKALRVLKQGGHMVAFNHSRMFHRMMVAIEDAGFEIRDTIMWLYGSGFPKSLNIGLSVDKINGVESQVVGSGKSGVSSHAFQSEDTTTSGNYKIKEAQNQWSGWGTALKPAYEPIVLARKPILEQNIAQNVLKWGVGGINIDECRVAIGDEKVPRLNVAYEHKSDNNFGGGHDGRQGKITSSQENASITGRFPANVIHDGSDEVVNGFPNEDYEIGGSPSRFFYTAKASQDDRNEGLDLAGFEARRESDRVKDDGVGGDNPRNRTNNPRLNTHPTVKPTDLMRYLVRLITPNGGTCLDLFMGSGSTGKAVMLENAYNDKNYHFIGIDMTPEYVEIAKARIDYAIANPFSEAKIIEVGGQKVLDKPISIFGDEE